ncbi:PREDICTED: LOW QUALITY PROTEIN: phosphorylase b kinase regulatory subunit alpha, skeletal muscle isoform-like [Branchiostoma belcheri]|uniref:Phosphorylase b kinase regulatory subunit n=1 Tax=Branchiostoma belcheri TaxID=7741 RepID=A0A6P4Z6P1_BRABE|nr:PREDICTED: LOW QUALITY PROTEIN: phosphorylase b kinase regulatory subunit alpha, skeletal muscle isoform-like [Branchiostoma belcheri]
MRSRSNSGVRLDYYQHLVYKTILTHQNPITGLLPASIDQNHAWVRDNLYCIMAVWGLSLAYKKTADMDEDRAKAYELEQSVVKLMRGLLQCMMRQVDKLEKFKYTQATTDALHAKYNITTCGAVVGDMEWGHLQIDATSLYILMLAQMTASGFQIIFTLDEVAFIQNLVFYVESAYRTPDYGMWERGDKTNHGWPELNASSIGMAKASLEAIKEMDLFGSRGGPASVIHVMSDEISQCKAILESMLPRESKSKEIDASLLSILSYPAFAVEDVDLNNLTKNEIISKLEGRYGLSRFLRDGYKTPMEDPRRLHYEPWELAVFEGIECEWPLFWTYLILDGLFKGDKAQVLEYKEKLAEVMVKGEDGLPLIPELYTIPADKVEAEREDPGSQERTPGGKMPHMWSQSLYILGCLIQEGYLAPGEIDPLNRRLIGQPRPDLVVQVSILAEDLYIQDLLKEHAIDVQTTQEVANIKVQPARVLSHIYHHLGQNKKLGLSGRPSYDIGLLGTSQLYTLKGQTFAFTPQFIDQQQFYLALDNELLVDMLKTDLAYLRYNWRNLGRPTVTFPVSHNMLAGRVLPPPLLNCLQKLLAGSMDGQVNTTYCDIPTTFSVTPPPPKRGPMSSFGSLSTYFTSMFCSCSSVGGELPPALLATLQKLISGYTTGVGIHVGKLEEFMSTSCFTSLDFLYLSEGSPVSDAGDEVTEYLDSLLSPTFPKRNLLSTPRLGAKRSTSLSRKASFRVLGSVRRSRSVFVDEHNLPGRMFLRRKLSALAESESEGGSADKDVKGDHIPDIRHSPSMSKLREGSGDIDCAELVEHLKDTWSLQEQADVLHYLYNTQGPDWDTKINMREGITVVMLVGELYEKAGQLKQWSIVRHMAGMLRKRVEDLAQAATDLLVRQKQLSVGLPPQPQGRGPSHPPPPEELAKMIYDSCGEDSSTAVLTQEILVYLAMFIRTEPNLFREMLRLRVGLIIQVMVSELARTLNCTGEEASEHLMSLSPFDLKTLLHHILSGKEFGVGEVERGGGKSLSIRKMEKEEVTGMSRLRKQVTMSKDMIIEHNDKLRKGHEEDLEQSMQVDRQGQWLRRRRLDGALNRVPVDFYTKIWNVLKWCQGLSIEGQILSSSVIKEMTPGELNFALRVEGILNSIPQPEYRQLMVEAMMVLALVVDTDYKRSLRGIIMVDKLVSDANGMFVAELKSIFKDEVDSNTVEFKTGAANICTDFYDSAPSGRFGTMVYMSKAVAQTLDCEPDSVADCTIA